MFILKILLLLFSEIFLKTNLYYISSPLNKNFGCVWFASPVYVCFLFNFLTQLVYKLKKLYANKNPFKSYIYILHLRDTQRKLTKKKPLVFIPFKPN